MDFFKVLKEKLIKGDIKKNIYTFSSIIIICIIILISWSIFFPKKSTDPTPNENITPVSVEKKDSELVYMDSLDKQLEQILSQINGVGDVDVMVTYETSTEVVPALNITKSQQTTEELDKQGGTRTVNQENTTENVVTTSGENYNNSPIVIKEIKPLIRGVIIVAEGANNPQIKNELMEAVTTIFQIKSHKVKVYPKN